MSEPEKTESEPGKAADAAPEEQAKKKKSIDAMAEPVNIEIQTQPRGKIYDSILQTIGGTPIVKIPKFSTEQGIEMPLLAKLEFFNPLSSVKDRAVLAMFEAAEKEGKITPGKTIIIEPTSGNSGVSLAFIGSAKGYRVILALPESVPLERQRTLSHYGAELVLTTSDRGMTGAVDKAEQILKEHKEDGFSFKQFENPACVHVHAMTTANEIWEDTGGNIDVLVAGVGTGATLTGIAAALKQKKPDLKVYAVEPEESAVLSEQEKTQHLIEGIGVGFIPPMLDQDLIDGILKVSSETAFETAQNVCKLDGIPCGISSGAALAAAVEAAKMPDNKGKSIVTILASSAERYIATPLFKNPNA